MMTCHVDRSRRRTYYVAIPKLDKVGSSQVTTVTR